MSEVENKSPRKSRNFDALEQQYRKAGEWASLAELYLESAKSLPDQKTAISRLLQAGIILRDKQKDSEKAQTCFDETISILSKSIVSSKDPVAQSDLLCDLAKIYLEVVRDREKAIESYVKAFELDPKKTHLMVVLGDIYSDKENWGDIASRAEADTPATQDPVLKAKYLGEIADIYNFIMAEPDQAIEMYQKILRLDPTNKKTISTLENLLIKGRRWGDLVTFYEEMKVHTKDSPDEIVSILTKLGLIFKDKLKEPLDAVRVYEEILRIQPKNFRVASKLEELQGGRELWQKTLQDLEEKAKGDLEKDQRIEILLRQTSIADRFLGKRSLASDKALEALRLDPSHTAALESAVSLWEKSEAWDQIALAYENAARHATKPESKLFAHRSLAKVAQERLKDPSRSIAAYESILAIEPLDHDARHKLVGFYESQRLWTSLEKLLESVASSASEPEASDSLLKLAQLRETNLEHSKSATEAYEKLIEISKHTEVALEALQRLYPQERRWSDLVSVYASLAAREDDPDEKAKLLFLQARTLEEKMGSLKSAAKIYEQVLPMTDDPAPLAGRIEQIYFSEKMWDELKGLYEGILSRSPTEADEARILFKLAELCEQKLSQIDQAREYLRQILQKRPKDMLALRTLERILSEQKNWEALIDIYRKEFEASEDPSEKVAVYLKAGDLYLSHLKDEKKAEECYRRVLTFDPVNLPALDFLTDFYRRNGRSGELIQILTARISSTTEQKPLSQLHFELARILESTRPTAEEAIPHYEQAIKLDTGLTEARDALSRIYERDGHWDRLAQVLIGGIDRFRDRVKGAELAERIGLLFQEKLNSLDEAVTYYRRSLELRSANPSVLRRLIATLEKKGASEEAVPYFEALLSLTPETTEKIQICIRLGEIHADVLKDPKSAAPLYERALDLGATSSDLLDRLLKLYKALGSWEGLLGIYERMLPSMQPEGAAKLHFQMGKIYQREVKSMDQAMMAFQIASELDPKFSDPLRAMRSLLRSEENWGEYLKVTTAEAALLDDTAEKASLLIEVARLWRDQFLQTDRAIEVFEEALKIETKNPGIWTEVSTLYLSKKDYPSALRAARSGLEFEKDKEKRIQLLERIGTIELRHQKRPAEATAAFRDILSISDGHRVAIENLAEIATLSKDWKGRLSALQMLLDLEESSEGKVSALFQIADLWKGPLESVANSIQTLQALLQIDPTNVRALTMLGEATEDPAQWAKVSGQILKELSKTGQADLFIQASLGIARIDHEKFKRTNEAIATLQKALKDSGDRIDLLDLLVTILEAKGESLAMADAALRRARLYSNPHEKATSLLAVADMWQASLDNPKQAAATLEEALALSPGLEPAVDRLLKIYEASEDWKAADRLLASSLASSDLASQKARERAIHRARLLKEHLSLGDESLKILEAVNQAAPDDRESLEMASVLYLEKKNWKKLAGSYEKLAELALGEQVIEHRSRLALLYEEQLRDLPRAIQQFELILRAYPKNQTALLQLERLLEQQGDFEALAAIIQEKVPLAENSTESARLYAKLAAIFRDKLKNPERATEYLEKSLAQDPSQEGVATELIEGYKKGKQFIELTEVWRRRAPFLPKEKAVKVYEELADAWRTTLGNPIAALEFLDLILKLDPGHQSALTKMAEIHEKNENYRALAWTLRRLAESMGQEPEAVSTWLRLGTLQAETLGSRFEAIETYQKVLALDPKQNEALVSLRNLFGKDERWGDLAEVLRKLAASVDKKSSTALLKELYPIEIDRLRQPQAASRTMEELIKLTPTDLEVLSQLEKLYEAQGQSELLASTLERELACELPSGRNLEILRKLGGVYDDRLKNLARATEVMEQVVTAAPSDLASLARLEGLYRKQKRPEDACRVLEQRADHLPDGGERTAILESLAERFAKSEKNQGDGIRCLEKLARDPAERRRAYSHLVDSYAVSKNHQKLAETLLLLIEECPDAQDKVPLLRRLGNIEQIELKNFEKSEKLFLAALMLIPYHPETVEDLKALYRQTEAWPKIARLIESGMKAETDSRRKISMLRELADLHRGPLKDQSKAVQLYEQLIQSSPHELNAISVLAELYFERKSWKEAAPLYDRLVKITTSKKEPERAARLFFELGTVMKYLGRNDDAIVHLNQSLTYDPNHAGSLRTLSDLYFELAQWNNALLTLQRVISLGRPEDEGYVDQQYYRLLQTLERLEKYDEAIRLFEDSRSRIGRHLGALKLVASLYFKLEKWDSACEIYQSILSLAQASPDRHPALFALAELFIRHLQRESEARGILQELLDQDSSHKQGLELYLALCERDQEWPDVLRTLEQLTQLETEPKNLSDLFFRLGRIHDVETGDIRKAREFYLRAIEVGEGHLGAMESLEHFCKTPDDWKKLATVYEKTVIHLRNKKDLRQAANFMLALGILQANRLSDLKTATQTLREAARLDPSSKTIRITLARQLSSEPASIGEAASIFQDILRDDPLDPALLREVSEFYKRTGKLVRSAILQSILVGLGEASQEERAFANSHPVPSQVKGKKGAGMSDFFPLLHADATSSLGRVISLLGDRLIPLFSSGERSQALLSATDVIPDHTTKAISLFGPILGIDPKSVSIYFSTSISTAELEFAYPSALGVGPGLYKLGEGSQNFVLAYHLASIRFGFRLFNRLSQSDTEDLLEALYALVHDRTPRKEGSAGFMTGLKKVLSRKDVRELSDSMKETSSLQGGSIPSALKGLHLSALYTAMLLSEDIQGALIGIPFIDPGLKSELVRFITCEDFFLFRERRPA